jgi:RNA polymerase sigma-70 factor, ECF subfamily
MRWEHPAGLDRLDGEADRSVNRNEPAADRAGSEDGSGGSWSRRGRAAARLAASAVRTGGHERQMHATTPPSTENAARPASCYSPRTATLAASDDDLVQRAKSGDAWAYGELISRYQDKVYTLIYGMVNNAEDALDLTQTVFLKAHTRLPQFRQDAVFYTWLYRIAANACIDFQRRRKRTPDPYSLDDPRLADGDFDPPSTRLEDDPHRAVLNGELGARVRRALGCLSPILQSAFILHDLQGLSQQEIAAVFRIPLGTAKSRIQRARLEMRERLRNYVEEA